MTKPGFGRQLFILCVAWVVAGCCSAPRSTFSYPTATAAIPAATCPPAETEVPFEAIMNPAFAADYTDCDAITTARFVNARIQTAYGLEAAHILFVVSAPNRARLHAYVAIRKDHSREVFSLTRGQLIQLRGGTFREGSFVPLAPPVFVATEVTRMR
jgi:hypothetical protein